MTAKPDATKGQSGKWGKGAGKASGLTWGDLPPGCDEVSQQPWLRDQAETAGVSRGHSTIAVKWEGPNIKEDEYFDKFEGRARKAEYPGKGHYWANETGEACGN